MFCPNTKPLCKYRDNTIYLTRKKMKAIVDNQTPTKAELAFCDSTSNAFENSPELWLSKYPWPKRDGHKYQRGHVLVFGGAEMTGASRLAARAALRIGAGVVTLAAPKSVWQVYASSLIGIIVKAVGGIEDYEKLLDDERRGALIVGPGAGVGGKTREAVLAALATKRSIVLDADAITSFESCRDALFSALHSSCIMTPHEGEFARIFELTGDRLERARAAAKLSGAVIVLKGSDTIIAAPDGRAIINGNAPPNLATAGSGDVLTGFIAGLLAQGLAPFEAAAAAVWLHGEAATEFGEGLIAEDLSEALPKVLKRLKSLSEQSSV